MANLCLICLLIIQRKLAEYKVVGKWFKLRITDAACVALLYVVLIGRERRPPKLHAVIGIGGPPNL